jgi:hypothetical protein
MFHRKQVIASCLLGLALTLSANMALAETEQYYGRWTVSDDKPAFSKKGILYKTIDIGPCNKDFCGVSVDEQNNCGGTLFRFFTSHKIDEELRGHAVWGDLKKTLILGLARPADAKPYVYLGLGEKDVDLSEREGSIPTFQANYKMMGTASCLAK